jgi:hypothetical protein
MGTTTTIRRRQAKHQNHSKIRNRQTALDHAVRVIYRVCCLAGSPNGRAGNQIIDPRLRLSAIGP